MIPIIPPRERGAELDADGLVPEPKVLVGADEDTAAVELDIGPFKVVDSVIDAVGRFVRDGIERAAEKLDTDRPSITPEQAA